MLCRGRTFFLPEVRLRKEAWTARPVGTGVWTRTGTGVATLDFWNFENEHVIENYNETTSVEVVTRWKSLNERNGNAAPNLRTKWCSSNLKPPWHPQASKPRAWPGIANFYGSGLSAQLCFFRDFRNLWLGFIEASGSSIALKKSAFGGLDLSWHIHLGLAHEGCVIVVFQVAWGFPPASSCVAVGSVSYAKIYSFGAKIGTHSGWQSCGG